MEKTFKPLMATDMNTDFTCVLMKGNGIRRDRGHDYVEIIPRDNIKQANGCVGSSNYDRMLRADDVLKDVLKRLRKDGYIILTKDCSDVYTGRFKATTYYLAGEEV